MRGGFGLIAILAVIGALWFTNAGSSVWKAISQIDQGCYSLMGRTGISAGAKVCGGLSRGVNALGQAGNTLRDKVNGWKQHFASNMPGGVNLNGLGSRISSMTSSSDMLTRMMQQGPQLSGGGNMTQRFQQAIDSYAIGQNYLKGGAPDQGIAWLQQGATQPQGYGVLSQLALGNLYSSGNSAAGISANPVAAISNYQQAKTSLTALSSSNTPQAQQMLQTLPASPQQMIQQIDQSIAQITRSMHK